MNESMITIFKLVGEYDDFPVSETSWSWLRDKLAFEGLP